VGPVDMGHLTYDPFCKKKKGADHYIVAIDFDDDFIWINDPEGYVVVPLRWVDFLRSWEARRIDYKKGSYTQRLFGRKVQSLPEGAIFRNVLGNATSVVDGKEMSSEALFGEEAIRCFARDLAAKGISVFELTFTFPTSNQRCYDSAIFLGQVPFTNDALKKAARIRMNQAKLFGKCRLLGAKKSMRGLLQTLDQIADLDLLYTEQLKVGAKEFRQT